MVRQSRDDGEGRPVRSGRGRRKDTTTERGPVRRLTPLYFQLYLKLRDGLAAGRHPPGVAIPSEPELARLHGVSRVTVRRTLEHLARDGLVERRHGAGTFPTSMPSRNDGPSVAGRLDALLSFEQDALITELAWEFQPSPPFFARLGEATCLRIRRLRHHRERPISLTALHVPRRYAGLLDRATIGDLPVAVALEREGVLAETAEQSLTAVAAGEEEARHLDVDRNAPLMRMTRLMLDANGLPTLHQVSFYVPDRFEYRMHLSRNRIGSDGRWVPVG